MKGLGSINAKACACEPLAVVINDKMVVVKEGKKRMIQIYDRLH